MTEGEQVILDWVVQRYEETLAGKSVRDADEAILAARLLLEKPVTLTAAELIAKLDAKCLGRTPEQSLRVVGNNGVPLTYIGRSYTTHVAGDLAGMADVIEEARNGLG